MPTLRLINPRNPINGLVENDIARRVTYGRKAIFMPLGLAVAAGCAPREWGVEIVDECTRPVPIAKDVDLVGITAMTCQAPRAYEIADQYRALGVPVVLGGIHPSAMPDEALQHATAVAVGEAEATLPRILADFAAHGTNGNRDVHPCSASWSRGIYRAEGRVAIGTPRRNLLNPKDYLVWNAVQTSRGCPHRCRFCTTHAMYAGRYTVRPVDEICDEVRSLRSRWVVFSDDNIVGHRRWARDLLTELAKLKVGWAGQVSLDVARDPEMLHLMKSSGCLGLIVGLESFNPASLAEGNKTFCHPREYRSLIRAIQSAGIGTWGSFCIGFDSDTVESVQRTVRFAERARLGITCYPILTPYPGTPLFAAYAAAGRLLTRDWAKYNGATVVFQPRGMTVQELANCQTAAFRQFYSWSSMHGRLGLLPLQKWTWIINVAIHQAFRYYYRRQKRRMPDFRDAAQWAREAV
jgi:radical SAM superfamily enzyme YgiQ (UPF0313 family)